MKEIQSLENKIHILVQAEGSTKNEINFWNGKVSTLKRDLDFQQSFNEKIQADNHKLQDEIENLQRLLSLKDKDLSLS